jgi:hypothetical protein
MIFNTPDVSKIVINRQKPVNICSLNGNFDAISNRNSIKNTKKLTSSTRRKYQNQLLEIKDNYQFQVFVWKDVSIADLPGDEKAILNFSC